MIWRKRRRPAVDHPSFGRMERDGNGEWTGEVHFPPTGQVVQIRVDGPADTLPQWSEACFRELIARFAELEPSILAAVLERYTRHEQPPGCPNPTSAGELKTWLVMDDIHLESPRGLRVGYGFEEGIGWDDAMFTVELNEWKVAHCWMDD